MSDHAWSSALLLRALTAACLDTCNSLPAGFLLRFIPTRDLYPRLGQNALLRTPCLRITFRINSGFLRGSAGPCVLCPHLRVSWHPLLPSPCPSSFPTRMSRCPCCRLTAVSGPVPALPSASVSCLHGQPAWLADLPSRLSLPLPHLWSFIALESRCVLCAWVCVAAERTSLFRCLWCLSSLSEG